MFFCSLKAQPEKISAKSKSQAKAKENIITTVAALTAGLHKVIIGQDQAIESIIRVFLAGGHVLLESKPGLGKTTLAKTFARLIGGEYNRISFTPDIMPMDILGSETLAQGNKNTLKFIEGPIFANILLCDEINRGLPKTQSALLEAMPERCVSVDKQRHPLPDPFFVLATQNPFDHEGVNPLPQTLIDRFMVRIDLHRLDKEHEKKFLSTPNEEFTTIINSLEPIDSIISFRNLRAKIYEFAREITVADEIINYLMALEDTLEEDAEIEDTGFSRALKDTLALVRIRAFLAGRSTAEYEDIQAVLPDILRHRLIPIAGGLEQRNDFFEKKLEEILAKTPTSSF